MEHYVVHDLEAEEFYATDIFWGRVWRRCSPLSLLFQNNLSRKGKGDYEPVIIFLQKPCLVGKESSAIVGQTVSRFRSIIVVVNWRQLRL